MKEDLLKIISTYGVLPQLKQFNEEAYELIEAIIAKEIMYQSSDTTNSMDKFNLEHIAEEIADCMVMIHQFIEYYKIDNNDISNIMQRKIDRQLERIENEKDNKSNRFIK
ncbi:MAG: MazG nucleotide pyrophosphohydrolase domain-containing protein [Candidatus Onthovivens sp.]|nr:MazG nucleotide pyrophosphohydrolase domain-containing protein [Candidatus Onthovivens sp.]